MGRDPWRGDTPSAHGPAYDLLGADGSSDGYHRAVARLADRLLEKWDAARLRGVVRRAGAWPWSLVRFLPGTANALVHELDRALRHFTEGVPSHLARLGPRRLLDPVLGTPRVRYHLHMLEVELTNRLNREAFARASWRMALFAHCLRDTHPGCAAVAGDVEEVCRRCRRGCLIRLGSELAEIHDVHPYIASTIDQERLFRDLRHRHPGLAVLGVACLPELVAGMRLAEGLGIPAVGVPLDSNRCRRWCGEPGETSFSLSAAEDLVGSGDRGPGREA